MSRISPTRRQFIYVGYRNTDGLIQCKLVCDYNLLKLFIQNSSEPEDDKDIRRSSSCCNQTSKAALCHPSRLFSSSSFAFTVCANERTRFTPSAAASLACPATC